ncbi:MAG TPA: CYTH domain-containing protein [Ktedonobacteraceae bacterium]
MIEVELKFAITPDSRSRLETYLGTIGYARRLQNLDIYYDTPSFDLFSQAVFVRVRNRQRLEFKFNEQAAPAHLFCTERAFSLTAGAGRVAEMNNLFAGFLPRWQTAGTISEALLENGLVELARIENRRAEYRYENLVVCVDHVKELGDFLEIETQCEVEGETPQAIEQVQAFAAGLDARQVHVGYVELWLQKHRPRAYRRGKYQEEHFSMAYS